MTSTELQEEELEVLDSIYEGDPCFKKISDTVFQYKIGEDGSHKSFLIEITWGSNYPEESPDINLETFYNKHMSPVVKTEILEKLSDQVESLLGCAMTYTLFEYAKENAEELMANQPEISQVPEVVEESRDQCDDSSVKSKEKKVQLSKSQKRKMYDRLDNKGENPRGWDWVDVIKHLSQTGKQAQKQKDS